MWAQKRVKEDRCKEIPSSQGARLCVKLLTKLPCLLKLLQGGRGASHIHMFSGRNTLAANWMG